MEALTVAVIQALLQSDVPNTAKVVVVDYNGEETPVADVIYEEGKLKICL